MPHEGNLLAMPGMPGSKFGDLGGGGKEPADPFGAEARISWVTTVTSSASTGGTRITLASSQGRSRRLGSRGRRGSEASMNFGESFPSRLAAGVGAIRLPPARNPVRNHDRFQQVQFLIAILPDVRFEDARCAAALAGYGPACGQTWIISPSLRNSMFSCPSA